MCPFDVSISDSGPTANACMFTRRPTGGYQASKHRCLVEPDEQAIAMHIV